MSIELYTRYKRYQNKERYSEEQLQILYKPISFCQTMDKLVNEPYGDKIWTFHGNSMEWGLKPEIARCMDEFTFTHSDNDFRFVSDYLAPREYDVLPEVQISGYIPLLATSFDKEKEEGSELLDEDSDESFAPNSKVGN